MYYVYLFKKTNHTFLSCKIIPYDVFDSVDQVQGEVVKIQVEHLAERWILKACVAERRAAPYGRLRSECGEPLIQKRVENQVIHNLSKLYKVPTCSNIVI